jgi:hypothetical protein
MDDFVAGAATDAVGEAPRGETPFVYHTAEAAPRMK